MAKKKQPLSAASVEPMTNLDHIAESLRALALPCADLVIDPANARKHSAKNIDAVKTSLRVYGQRKPIVVNRKSMVVEAGNGTLKAAKALGWSHIAVVLVDDGPATAVGFGIADNRTAELAEWDQEALDKLLIDLEFDDRELQALLEELKTVANTAAGNNASDWKQKFQVLVICKTEDEQAALLSRLTAEGLECRSLIS